MRTKIRKDNVNEDDEVSLRKLSYAVYPYDVPYRVLAPFITGIHRVDLLLWAAGVLQWSPSNSCHSHLIATPPICTCFLPAAALSWEHHIIQNWIQVHRLVAEVVLPMW